MFSSIYKKIKDGDGGYSLLELILTLSVLAVLVMGSLPLAQNAAKRQKEERLRETLRLVRNAIDEFKRDTIGGCQQGTGSRGNQTVGNQGNAYVDPRSRVVIDDCTIFDAENIDKYPPDLETLVNGIRVKARAANLQGGSGIREGSTQASEMNSTEEVIKVYLRELPIDPMTGENDWLLRSSYQEVDSESWDSINLFDIRSSSEEEGLNGEKYSDW